MCFDNRSQQEALRNVAVRPASSTLAGRLQAHRESVAATSI
jgi:hypothetical protein